MKEGGAGAATGKLSPGMELLKINGVATKPLAKKDVTAAIKTGPDPVVLEVGPGGAGYDAYVTKKAAKDAAKSAAPAAGTAPATAAPAAAGGADELAGLGRLQLIKRCREKGLDYKPIAKDLDALRALIRGSQ